ncbi:MAG: serine/threonine protein kinase [Verrucomicrobiae bacterium]|nr:serine/threonine protein kinase [Verrucomicrobiae bacterium]
MVQPRQCPECGAELRATDPEGVCLLCAFKGALLPAPETPVSEESVVHYFGDYRLSAKIGEGGMGTVYRARQDSLNRIVAVKVMRAGLLASEAEVRRFQREAQAAANLQHPNIVAVYEVGRFDGHHFYSMQFISGENLEQKVRARPLSVRAAAGYVETIAKAVHFAHQQGTIHRDLKPTNILIDEFDEPHITDFGLVCHSDSDENLTLTGQIVGTPAFMAPEQVAAKSKLVSPLTDIYATGAVLYYLLTQKAPFTSDTLPGLLALVAGPSPPVSPRSLNPTVPLDLETICLKCLEKRPDRRYPSAQALADELKRFRRNEPILARPPHAAEKVLRWCARNRTVAWSLGAVALTLVTATAVSVGLAVRAKQAERITRQAYSQSRQVVQFLTDMLQGVGPATALGRDTTLLREILDQAADRVETELREHPEVCAEIQAIMGNIYQDLGEFAKAEALHRAVLQTTTNLWGAEHTNTASALVNLALVLQRQNNLEEAEALTRQTLDIRRRLLGEEHPDVAMSLHILAQLAGLQGRLEEAAGILREVITIQRRLEGEEHPHLATTVQNLGQTLRMLGRLDEAAALEQEALAMRRKVLPPDHPHIAVSLNGLAIVLNEQGRYTEADGLYREALALRKKLVGNEHPDVAETLNNLANNLQDQGRLAEAAAMHREALAVNKNVFGLEHPKMANSLNNLAFALREAGDLVEAETAMRQALDIWKRSYGAEHFQVATALHNLATVLRDANKLGEAEATQREALALLRKLLGETHPRVANALHNLGTILERHGKLAEAESSLRQGMALRRDLLGGDHPNVADSLEALARLLRGRGELDAAATALRECLQIRQQRLPDAWETFSAQSALGECLLARTDYSEAEPLLLAGATGLLERQARIPPAARTRLTEALEALIRLHEATGQPTQVAAWRQKLAELTLPAPPAPEGNPK